MKTKKAFTLVEVLLVVLILGVLASLMMPRVATSAEKASVAECDTTRASLVSALERYALNRNGKLPGNNTAFQSDVLNNTTYFPHGAPTCTYGTAYVFDKDADTITAHTHP